MHESVLGDATTSRTPRPPKHRTNEPR
jgi:hypothetical protein